MYYYVRCRYRAETLARSPRARPPWASRAAGLLFRAAPCSPTYTRTHPPLGLPDATAASAHSPSFTAHPPSFTAPVCPRRRRRRRSPRCTRRTQPESPPPRPLRTCL
jgi:hypothetical protein